MLGTGAQARTHLRAFAGIRDWDEVRVAGRDPEKARALAAETGATAARSFEEAVRGADVVAATTHADAPVVYRDWLAPGAHVSSVGYNQAGSELDPAIVAEATVVVETRAVLAPPPAGALELAGLDESAIHAELGELVAGTRPGSHLAGGDNPVQVGRRRRPGPRRCGARPRGRAGARRRHRDRAGGDSPWT